MAAPAGKMVGVGEESSSDDDEEALRRCQEAVWETRGEPRKDGGTDVQQSKRVVVAAHEHDGNELQVTQGFRTHVAKKLGNLLDSCITEMQTEASSHVESANRDNDDDDGGFRLFSTSVPGQTADEPSAPVRRRPVPSSSDSDSEMETRLKEAAVSIKDLLPSSAFSEELHCSENTKKEKKKKKKRKEAEEEEEESHVVQNTKDLEEDESNVVKKKKKKRKENGEDCAASQRNGEQEVKRKKKKKREGSAEEETLN